MKSTDLNTQNYHIPDMRNRNDVLPIYSRHYNILRGDIKSNYDKLNAIYWNDLRFPFTRDKQGQSSLPHFDFTELGLLFPQNDNSEIVYLIAQFPHSRKNGSNIKPHIHFIQTSSSVPVFKMDYRWYKNGDAVPSTFTTITTDSLGFDYSSGDLLQIASFPEIDGSDMDVISIFMDIKIYRVDNVVTGDVLVKEFDIHYQIDADGSKYEFIK